MKSLLDPQFCPGRKFGPSYLSSSSYVLTNAGGSQLKMKAVEVFAGAGGMSDGLKSAGFEMLRAYDAWPLATENYIANVGSHAEIFDLNDVAGAVAEIARLSPDIICGGPPCQDYSLAGKRKELSNANLTKAFAMMVSGVRPEWFLMENVVQVLTSKTWAVAKAVLEHAGYGITVAKVDCSFFGVPQSRRRAFVIGRLSERDGFLDNALGQAASSRPMTLRDLFGASVPVWGADEPAPTLRSPCLRPMPANYRAHNEDAALIENGYVYTRPFSGGRGVRSVDEPMSTITRTSFERPTNRYLSAPHPKDTVSAADTAVLTVSQISRIQGFREDWNWIGTSKRDIAQMIANAVPSPVAARIGKVILDRHRGVYVAEIAPGFVKWLAESGRARSSVYNVKSCLRRAQKLLSGRVFPDVELEIVALERSEEFAKLSVVTRSNLRQAVRLYSMFLSSQEKSQPPTAKRKLRTLQAAGNNDNSVIPNADSIGASLDFGT